MRKYAFLLLSLGLVACGPEYQPSLEGYYREVDPDLEQYVQVFEQEWGKQVDFKVKISDIPSKEGRADLAGVCYRWSDGKKVVVVDTEFFATKTTEQIEQLVMHELGHCALGRDHDDSEWTADRYTLPYSVMRSWAFNNTEAHQYVVHYNRYMDELFQRNEFSR